MTPGAHYQPQISDSLSSGSLGLALGSGSARGLAHIGVLKVLEREGLPIDLIAGTSIGALIGGAYAIGLSVEEIEAIALATSFRRLVSFVDVALPTRALVNGKRIEDFIREIADGRTFADTRVPFACVAVDVTNGREVVLREGDLATAIRASISTPVVFAPVEHEGRLLVDGAVLNAVPVDVVREMGADVVIAVTTQGDDSRPDAASLEVVAPVAAGFVRSASTRAVSLVRRRVRTPAIYHHGIGSLDLMMRGLAEPRLRSADLVIAPQLNGFGSYSFYRAASIIAMGETSTEAALGEIRRLADRSQGASGECGGGRVGVERGAPCGTL